MTLNKNAPAAAAAFKDFTDNYMNVTGEKVLGTPKIWTHVTDK